MTLSFRQRRSLCLIHDILCDPSFGFALCNILYGLKANTVALAGAFVCATLIILQRCLRQIYPAQKMLWQKCLHNDQLSLSLLGVVIIFSSLYTLQAALTDHNIPALLQGIAGVLFGGANLMIARQLGNKHKNNAVGKLLLQPETWMAGGMLCIGLMTGPYALALFPFVYFGYRQTLANLRQGQPEYTGHPKLWYAIATLGFAGLAAGDVVLCTANILNAIYLVILEAHLMPGGIAAFTRRLAFARVSDHGTHQNH